MTGAQDFFFTVETTQLFTVRAYASQYGIDSHLWLYNSTNQLIAANDDYYGLDSYISRTLQPDTYRLRAGVCCGDPNRWYGSSYQIDTNFAVIGGVATTTTTTEPPTTTTTEPPTTTTTTPLPENANWSMVFENDYLELVAPQGQVFSEILFASYGTPNGNYGHWTIGNCHASNSQAIVEEYALGNNSFRVPATNTVFGDPCGGTPKRLAVTALYAPAPTTTTTTSTTTTLPPTTEMQTTVPETTTTTSTTSLPASTTTEPESTTSEPLPTSTTQPDVPETTSPTTSTPVSTTTSTQPKPSPPPLTSTSSTSTSTTTTQPVVVAPTTTTTSEPAPRSEQVGSTTVPPTTFTVPEVVVTLPPTEVLLELPKEQLQEVFQNIDIENMTPEQQTQLIQELTNAPDDVKKTFEATVNVFGGGFDTYVPTGSKVDVKTRKVIIAATGVISVLPTPSSAPPSAPTSGGSPSGAPSDSDGTTSEEKPRKARRGRK